jgi:hypothetical protein
VVVSLAGVRDGGTSGISRYTEMWEWGSAVCQDIGVWIQLYHRYE